MPYNQRVENIVTRRQEHVMRAILFILSLVFQMAAAAQSFDQSHAAFSETLSKYVAVYDDGLSLQLIIAIWPKTVSHWTSILASLSAVEPRTV